MIGHLAIIAMRQARQAPVCVTVKDFSDGFDWTKYNDAAPEVVILSTERIEQLDLRWAVGLTVEGVVQGTARAKQVFDAFVSASAKRVHIAAYERFMSHGQPQVKILENMETESWLK